MSLNVSLPQDDTPQERYQRERNLAAQQLLYDWSREPGLPPMCKGLPAPERFSKRAGDRIAARLDDSILNGALGLFGWLRRAPTSLHHYNALFVLQKAPRVKHIWMQDREFARERMNGVNPFLITCIEAIPENFPVTDEHLRGVVPEGVTLAHLLDQRRLFLCDWKEIAGAPLVFGRFQAAPMALFWLDNSANLMPLAIQLGQSPAEAPVIFTPADHKWLWLTARSYVACAEGTYHELIAHLTRTHLVMEAVWVAASRTLAPEHPIHELLGPHFTGTIAINYDALNKLIVPGGPIDVSIAVGSDGGLWLCEQEYKRWRFDYWNPRADLERRGVLDPDVLPGYYYRDDALKLFDAIGTYAGELMRVFYRGDEDVREDTELQAWARELVAPEGGHLRGTPVTPAGRFESLTDLIRFLQQVIYTVSVEHAAVNNGQWDQFGYVPNTPGAMYMPPPTTKHPTDEARLTYAMPAFKPAIEQMTLARLLSEPTITPIGSYPNDFFTSSVPAQHCVDRFRSRLDDIAFAIEHRNNDLDAEDRYTYLLPFDVGRSIAI